MPSLISLADLESDEVRRLVLDTVRWSETGYADAQTLAGTVIGLYFAQPSTRTRTAFSSAALRLGARLITYGPGDLQLSTGECEEDTGMVLAAMIDALVVRSAVPHDDLARLTQVGGLRVVNAMNADEHPTQALADLATIHQERGAVDGSHVLYVGEVNSTTRALAWALASFPRTRLSVAAPPGYAFAPEELDRIGARAHDNDSQVVALSKPQEAEDVDVVYTTQWETTGTSKPDPNWRDAFDPDYRVDTALMSQWPAARFMHDLPARRGDEVTGNVLDGPASLAPRQAANKLHSAAASLVQVCGATT